MTHDAETVERVAAEMWESRNATKFSEAVNQDLIAIYRGLARAALDTLQPTVAEADFVRDFSFRAMTREHDKDELELLSRDSLLFERDCDIERARALAGEDKA